MAAICTQRLACNGPRSAHERELEDQARPARPLREIMQIECMKNYKKLQKIASFMVNSGVILMCEMIRTLLFSDEPILAKGLESVLASVDGFQLTGVCSNTGKLKEIL